MSELALDLFNAISEIVKLRKRVAELSQAVGLITTLKPTMVMDTEHPLDMAKEVVEYVTVRIDELEAAQRWIPVSERLPEDLQPTVIITKGGMTGIVRYLELYGREGFGSWSEDVTHWMPLTQPPEVQQ